MVAQIPEEVKNVMTRLEAAGYQAWCVGGAVRDLLLGRTPGDWDVTTNALPEAVLAENPATVEILYKRQIRQGDKVQFFYSYDPEAKKHLVELKNGDGKKSHALVWFY